MINTDSRDSCFDEPPRLPRFEPEQIPYVAEEPPKPRVVSLEDRQTIELLYIKIENLKLQTQLLDSKRLEIEQQKLKLQKELLGKSEEFKTKYGIVLGKDQVNPDGSIVSQGS